MKPDDDLTGQNLAELMKKYDHPGPRYTSYPTAPLFSKEFDYEKYKREISKLNHPDNKTDLSLYLHIPFCDTLCYFCGCTTIITQNRERGKEYLDYLKREIDLLSPYIHPNRKVIQMHWGGGTPKYLTPTEISGIASYIKKHFNFTNDAELSVEINPKDLTLEHLQSLRQNGFNRISIGVQDYSEKVLSAINRHQGEKITRQAIEWSRSLGFVSLNLDLVYGLPLQTLESFEKTVDNIIKVSPEHISVYNFAYVPWIKPHQKLIKPEDLPTPENKMNILLMAIKKFMNAGYVYIGMDHFAQADDELTISQMNKSLHRNFQGYSTKAGCDLFGIGMSSISHFTNNYARNAKTLTGYYQAINAGHFAIDVGYQMSFDDELRKYIIMRLMCDLVLETSDVEKKFNIVFGEYFKDTLIKLQSFIEDKLLQKSGGSLKVTSQGRLFLRNIAMCFDAYIIKTPKEKSIFSKAI